MGIDGGGTSTRALLADERGGVLRNSQARFTNPSHATDSELHETLQELFAKLFTGFSRESCVSVFAGVAGVICGSTASRIADAMVACGFEHARIGVDHDMRIALAGGLGGKPGIALVVGTGSSCYGRDAQGGTWQTGGWGALVGDEGSGYFLGLHSIIAAVRMADGRLAQSKLMQAVFEWLGIRDVSEILKRLYEDGIERHEVAGFAPVLLDFAARGDAVAQEILNRGAEELAAMVAANHRALPTSDAPDVVITGGVGDANHSYRQKIDEAILRLVPQARIHQPMMKPVAGAVMLAIEQDEGHVAPEVLATLRRTSR